MAGFTSYVRREPIGVAGLIAPWNYPLMMAIWKIGPALATGNAIVLKPSEMTPLTALKLAELTADILPPGVFNVVTGDGVPVGDTLVRHPDVGIVSLTGDTATGKLIAANSAETLKRVHLELGGKAPFIVFDDADMEQVVEWIKIGGYFNSGQDCTASARILVGSGAYENVLAELVPAVESIKVGDPFADDTEMGSMVSKEQLERVVGFVERAEGGRQGPHGAWAIDQDGFWYSPTVVSDVGQDAEIIQKEVFGPVVTVQRFDDEAQAPSGRTACRTGFRAPCGRATSGGRTGWLAGSSSGACGSTRTSRSPWRCRTAGTSSPATGRTCRCTRWRTTRT